MRVSAPGRAGELSAGAAPRALEKLAEKSSEHVCAKPPTSLMLRHGTVRLAARYQHDLLLRGILLTCR